MSFIKHIITFIKHTHALAKALEDLDTNVESLQLYMNRLSTDEELYNSIVKGDK
jgi:hypothetical protein